MHFYISKNKKSFVYILLILMFHLILRSEVGQKKQEFELPIVIVTTSYNNAHWVMKYLDSVFMQEYDNFRLIYIDDCSTDGTAEIVQTYVEWHGLQDKVTLIKNNVRKLKLENMYKVIHSCNDSDIIVILDGDDWFAHPQVLKKINQAYLCEDVWFTYSQSKYFPCGGLEPKAQKVVPSVLKKRNFRTWKWVYRHPRTFYAWLFKLVQLKDLLTDKIPGFEGKFYPFCNDRAMIYPMLEMAQYRIRYIDDISVIQNKFSLVSSQDKNSTIDKLRLVKKKCHEENVDRLIQYKVLEQPVINRLEEYTSAKVDCLILSDNNPVRLSDFLKEAMQYIQSVDQYCVIYQADDHLARDAYQQIKLQFPHIQYCNVSLGSQQLVSVLCQLKQKQVLFFSDTQCIGKTIDCAYAAYEKELAFAYSFDMSVSCNMLDDLQIPYQHIGNGLYAWKFCSDKTHQFKVNHTHGSLYTTKQFIAVFQQAPYATINQLKSVWESTDVDLNNIGLFVDKEDIKQKRD